jgi:hypothetical protein
VPTLPDAKSASKVLARTCPLSLARSKGIIVKWEDKSALWWFKDSVSDEEATLEASTWKWEEGNLLMWKEGRSNYRKRSR